jgi:hypothetical protein
MDRKTAVEQVTVSVYVTIYTCAEYEFLLLIAYVS